MFEFPMRSKRVAVGGAIIIAVAVSCLGTVRAQRFVVPARGVSYTCSSGKACVEGSSAGNPYGVEGVSVSADGIHGVTSSTTGSSGVAGEATGKSGTSYGVFGSSSNGPGVYGLDADYYGVEGVSTNADGVYGSSANGDAAGVYGVPSSSGGYGVEGIDAPNGSHVTAGVLGIDSGKPPCAIATCPAGVKGVTTVGVALAAYSASTGLIFSGASSGGGYCSIDSYGNLNCSGKVTAGADVRNRHRTSAGRHVIAYESESTSATIEDFGTARLVHGAANVQMEPTFASTIDRNSSYYVFLTPLGDTRGLYVSTKTPSGFQIRETEGGHSSIDFDYRIVAHPVDAGAGRLPRT